MIARRKFDPLLCLQMLVLALGRLFPWQAQAAMQKLMFNKNLGVAGGLLAFAAFGAGAFSLDGRRQRGGRR